MLGRELSHLRSWTETDTPSSWDWSFLQCVSGCQHHSPCKWLQRWAATSEGKLSRTRYRVGLGSSFESHSGWGKKKDSKRLEKNSFKPKLCRRCWRRVNDLITVRKAMRAKVWNFALSLSHFSIKLFCSPRVTCFCSVSLRATSKTIIKQKHLW